ncbi:MAG: hypothetical protein RL657_2721 [Pseudomonadota bacterium]
MGQPHLCDNRPMSTAAILSEIWVYPLKSCAGISVRQSTLTETGLEWDRTWMVVDAQGSMVTQRELPAMALIETRLRATEVVLRAHGMLALHLAMDQAEGQTRVEIWGQQVPAYDMGDLAAQWLTDFLAQTPAGRALGPLRLARFDPDHQRPSDPQWAQGHPGLNTFGDGFPLLIAGAASLQEFNRRARDMGRSEVDIQRFRPNLVIAGLEPHQEDRLQAITLQTPQGPVEIRPVKPCVRCSVPDVDPADGQSDGAVNPVLQSYRQDPRMNGALTFGMNAIVTRGLVPAASEQPEPVLSVGMAVEVA